MRRAIAAFFLVVAAVLLIAGLRSFASARDLRARSQRVHAEAVKTRINRSHDERAFLKAANGSTALGWIEIVGAVACALLALRALGYDERRWVARPSYAYPSGPAYGDGYASFRESNGHSRGDGIKAAEARKKSGDQGEALVCAALMPLVNEGWCIAAVNSDVDFGDGQKFGDVDILLKSPNGVAYSIDAKNGSERVWYDRKNQQIVFDGGWHGKQRQRRPYPVSRAELLARWVREKYGYEHVVPVMCFTATMNLRYEHQVGELHLVKIANLCDTLRRIDPRYGTPLQHSIAPQHTYVQEGTPSEADARREESPAMAQEPPSVDGMEDAVAEADPPPATDEVVHDA